MGTITTIAKKAGPFILKKEGRAGLSAEEKAAKAEAQAAKKAAQAEKDAASEIRQKATTDRLLAAPAVQTSGNAPLISKIYEAAKLKRTPDYPMAKEPVFDYAPDYGLQETKDLVPQRSVAGETPPMPSLDNMPYGGRSTPIFENAEEIANRMASDIGAKMGEPGGYKPMGFYSTGPVIRGLTDKGGLSPEQSQDFMRSWSGQGAATSPRTKTPPNLRNASYLLHRQAIGDPLTQEKWNAEGNLPGFPMIGRQHLPNSEAFFAGNLDAWNNPKPYTFRENWSGNLQDPTADTHYIRKTLDYLDQIMPGQIPRGWFDDQASYDKYVAEKGFPKEGQLPGEIKDTLEGQMVPGTGRWGQTEYPVLQLPGRLAAQKLNITPAEAQAAMWFIGGPRTGLLSPQMTIPDLLNAQIEATARATGLAPERILKLWSTGAIPLAQNDEQKDMPGASAVG